MIAKKDIDTAKLLLHYTLAYAHNHFWDCDIVIRLALSLILAVRMQPFWLQQQCIDEENKIYKKNKIYK